MPLALLVDRDADTRHMYAEWLQQTSCDTEEAEDGREALAKAIARHPDVVVTETRLPGISGYDLCRLLRDDVTTRDIPIIVVTGDAFAADRTRAVASGADVVLVKPCLPEDLGKTIRDLVVRSRETCQRAEEVVREVGSQIARAKRTLDQISATRADARRTRGARLSRAHNRHDTRKPALAPPALACPQCDRPLTYLKSHVGGVSARHQEQWDYLECAAGCGVFQYRQRTGKLRRVP